MVRFYGTASGKVDDKGRVVLPAAFRDAMVRGGSENMAVVVKKNVQQCCIDLFPEEEWEKRSGKVLEGIDP
ncbi:MAG: MraZ N-terminal domain-containing protein, partial [Candidatus Cryptobacteroides sp.]|nr:MraZ N-terminal domain-containing protein [Candidatus Cryptobacteroides sp.]